MVSSLGQAAPRPSTHDLRAQLDALLEDWRPMVQAGQDDEDVRKAAPEQFLEELEDPRWGQFSLNTSRWLLAGAGARQRLAVCRHADHFACAGLGPVADHEEQREGHVVILSVGTQRIGFVVDQLVGQEEVVITSSATSASPCTGLYRPPQVVRR